MSASLDMLRDKIEEAEREHDRCAADLATAYRAVDDYEEQAASAALRLDKLKQKLRDEIASGQESI